MQTNKTINQSSMVFTAPAGQTTLLVEISGRHGIEINIAGEGDIVEWSLRTPVDAVDMCNLLNEIGYAGILTTASFH